MHRVIQDHLEDVLAGSGGPQESIIHLQQCGECREEITAMRDHAAALRQIRAEAEPRAGFYARVMERIEAQKPISMWSVFSDSPFGKRLAAASMAMAVLFGVYLVTSEQFLEPARASHPTTITISMTNGDGAISDALPGEDQPAMVLSSTGSPNRDAVLVNLVTYRGQ